MMERKVHVARLRHALGLRGESPASLARKDRRIKERTVEAWLAGDGDGSRSGDMLRAIADVLRVDLDDFTSRSGVDDEDEEGAA